MPAICHTTGEKKNQNFNCKASSITFFPDLHVKNPYFKYDVPREERALLSKKVNKVC